jgi:hypothetical protein
MKRYGLFAGILLASSAFGQVDPQASALLVKLRAAYSSLKSVRAVGQAKFVGRQKQLVVSSVVQFKAPMNFRIETTGVPGTAKPTYTLITDGKKLHVDGLPGGAYTRHYSYQELLRSLPQANLETLCFFDWRIQFSTDARGNMHRSTFKVFQDKWSGRNWTVLEETAKDQHIFVDYYIDPATNLIWKTAVFDIGQKTPYNEFWFTKLEVNPKLEAAAFRIN